MAFRLDLVREVCEDLRSGLSPYPRLNRRRATLDRGFGFGDLREELRFVDSVFLVLLGASPAEAVERLEVLMDHTPRPERFEKALDGADCLHGLSSWR